ncbi:beta-N-acetylhexosaminidase [Ruminiclostridium herbifermentans]|uniref:Beta-N-acetylhexosaminidase n=1 Tax=Ruminiclostridium herbifermentans TaxID=2488810 RepID=A0A4U7JGA3_9FIRM|nr:beta-N-acetylhexosaminidase [Ruminiclostridium herbifermentans]QNU66693.1 beta-N-acetylhexosaminidase [Ruminiclostridium herbifermentans]
MRKQRNRYFTLVLALSVMLLLIYFFAVYFANGIDKQNSRADISQSNTSNSLETSLPIGKSTLPDIEEPANDSSSFDSNNSIAEQVKNLSLDEKIGQLVIVGVDGYFNNENSRQLIEKYHVGGFIFFKRNIQNSDQMLSLLNSLKETNAVNKLPLFLSIDEEGGRISRMPDEFLKLPSNQKIGEHDNEFISYQIGTILGEQLKMYGFNMDFAPVLDINSNPKNPVIGDRSFGSEPNIVTKLGIQTMMGLQEQNIISVVKHFPGHGDTSEDSHKSLPVVNSDLNRLNSFELIPFNAAIENNAEVIMVAHILLPKIDAENPASLSETIITELLRKNMNFNGVVITDDFTMGAIEKNYEIGKAAVKSIQAGCDIVLVCHDFHKQETVIKAIKDAVLNGQISIERINQSIERIIRLKHKYRISDMPVKTVDPQSINKKIMQVLQ